MLRSAVMRLHFEFRRYGILAKQSLNDWRALVLVPKSAETFLFV